MKSYSNASDIPPAVRSVFSAPPQTKEKTRSYKRAFSFMLIHRGREPSEAVAENHVEGYIPRRNA